MTRDRVARNMEQNGFLSPQYAQGSSSSYQGVVRVMVMILKPILRAPLYRLIVLTFLPLNNLDDSSSIVDFDPGPFQSDSENSSSFEASGHPASQEQSMLRLNRQGRPVS